MDRKILGDIDIDNFDARNGLPEQLFLDISTLVPIVNVDLLILNRERNILLSWRDDEYFGKGWHLPGGCIRYKESMMERLQLTAMEEIGAEVITNRIPITVKEVILGKNALMPKLRAHHIAILFECKVHDDYFINNHGKIETDAGYLKWFPKIPQNILDVHEVYFDIFKEYDLVRDDL